MSEKVQSAPNPIECPPATPVPAREMNPDPRTTLHRLASELMRVNNRGLLVEFLKLRRALR